MKPSSDLQKLSRSGKTHQAIKRHVRGVVIIVEGGVAEVAQAPEDVPVTIIDLDNAEVGKKLHPEAVKFLKTIGRFLGDGGK